MINIVLLFISLSLISIAKSDSVCDLNTLLVEVKQDLKDNGMLDCLRVIDPPHSVEETEDQKNLRLAAQWDTSCAFEANGSWEKKLKKVFDINTLVDSVGEPVKKNFENQADMCEIIRAALAQNLFNIPDLNMQKLPMSIIDKIDCAGTVMPSAPTNRICAASGTSYFMKDSWTIFMESNAIQLAGNPVFTVTPEDPNQPPDFVNSPFTNKANPIAQNKLIKDLLKYTPDQLDNKEAELVNMIDNAINKNKNEDQAPDKKNQKENSETAHVHVKRIDEFNIENTNGKFTSPDVAALTFGVDTERLVFGFYLVSYELEKSGEIFYKMNMNKREIPETRSSLALVKQYTQSGAFAEVFNPGKDPNCEMRLSYISNTPGKSKTDTKDFNFSFGSITMPTGAVFKRYNTNKIELSKADEFAPIQEFELQVKNSSKKAKNYMIMYTLSFLINKKVDLQTRILINGEKQLNTSSFMGSVAEVGVHNGNVFSLPAGDNKIEIDYRYTGASISLNDVTDNKYVQSIYAFEMPDDAIVNMYKMEKPLSLDTKGSWKPMQIDGKFNLTTKKTALIIYHINVKTNKKMFKARVRINNSYNKKSIILTEGLKYGYAHAYVAKVLKKGSYSLDLEYMSDSSNTYSPELQEVNGESIYMQVILLD